MKRRSMKLWAKIVSLCLVLVLTISVGVPAAAKTLTGGEITPDSTGTITVTGSETEKGARVTAYKIIDVNAENNGNGFQPLSPMYQWVESVADWMKNYIVTTEDETQIKPFETYVGEGNEVTNEFADITGQAKTEFYVALRDAILNRKIEIETIVTKEFSDTEKPTAVFENMAMGQWFINIFPNEEHQNYEYAPAVADLTPKFDEKDQVWKFENKITVVAKSNPGTIEKDVNDHTVEIGQTVHYTLNVPVPTYPDDATAKMFRIGDKFSSGITFETDEKNNMIITAVYADGSTQKIGSSSTDTSEGKTCFKIYYNGIDYGQPGDQENPPTGETGREFAFMIDFNYDNLKKDFGVNGESVLQSIQVTYDGTINENAILRPGDPGYPGEEYPGEENPLDNVAYVGQNNDPYDNNSYTPTEDKERLYTYGIEVAKVAEDKKTPLAGAEFQLMRKVEKGDIINFVQTADGEYRVAKAGEDSTETLVVGSGEDNKGKLNLEGLATGTYYLWETKAPDGYELLKDPIKIEIIDKEADDDTYDFGKNPNDDAGIIDGGTDHIYHVSVTNKKPPILPLTGGMGTVIFSTVGIILMAGAVVLLVSYRRRKRA